MRPTKFLRALRPVSNLKLQWCITKVSLHIYTQMRMYKHANTCTHRVLHITHTLAHTLQHTLLQIHSEPEIKHLFAYIVYVYVYMCKYVYVEYYGLPVTFYQATARGVVFPGCQIHA